MTYLLLFGATVLWGIWGYANKLAVNQAHPLHVQWMYSLPLILLIPLWYLLGRSQQPDVPLTGTALVWALVSGLAAALAFSLMLFALRSASATAAVALTSAYPIVTALIAYFTGTEKLSTGQIVAIGVIISGVVLFEVTGSKSGG
ncbi:MAG: DMT family transporter [Anaerolineae bacterium]|nr:DMT family transporter [Anaerolineae bacterium]